MLCQLLLILFNNYRLLLSALVLVVLLYVKHQSQSISQSNLQQLSITYHAQTHVQLIA